MDLISKVGKWLPHVAILKSPHSIIIKRLIIIKNKANLLFKKFPNVTNEVLYKQYRTEVNSKMRLAERKYYQNMLENNRFNLKKTW